jgi:hypothetical protein
MERFCLILALCGVLASTGVAQAADPCGCAPQRGKKPYRLTAKTETKYESYPASGGVLTPLAMLRWEKKYAAKANGTTVGRLTARLHDTPEDSLYTLEGYMWYVQKEIDCDYHIQIGPAGKTGKHRAVVEVTHENCSLQSVIDDTLRARGYTFGKEFPRGIPVTVTGLGFYDWQHGVKHPPSSTPPGSPLEKQEGTAWELHPVKSILFK